MTITARWANADHTVLAVEIDGLALSVPNVPGNRHRQMVAAWEAAGNTIDAYVAPAPEPAVLKPYQFFAVLELSGKKLALDAYIDGLTPPADIIARAKLDHTLEFRRGNDLVLAAQKALGLTDQELDALWTQAAAIQ